MRQASGKLLGELSVELLDEPSGKLLGKLLCELASEQPGEFGRWVACRTFSSCHRMFTMCSCAEAARVNCGGDCLQYVSQSIEIY